jgi:hypothetical protein
MTSATRMDRIRVAIAYPPVVLWLEACDDLHRCRPRLHYQIISNYLHRVFVDRAVSLFDRRQQIDFISAAVMPTPRAQTRRPRAH